MIVIIIKCACSVTAYFYGPIVPIEVIIIDIECSGICLLDTDGISGIMYNTVMDGNRPGSASTIATRALKYETACVRATGMIGI